MPIYRSRLVPLEDLPRLLLAADVHLITLRDPFVGYVLPSKVHACIESGKRSSSSAASHPTCTFWPGAQPPDRYCRVDVGDVEGLLRVLDAIERAW